ncbi:imidazole glycerol phosphate synthase subunit HisH [Marinobacterium sp. LSUCC0821]|uniref:imidazole glycerol phosphate synthase subunit HisH n=1 Tax=Marinobacterium sp. LSUCC0821 TaxID=2668067 RepID=UPI00200509EC|nr:imidazole glycerol phosphate synthase subunit HisH [Marinobacterium sp. LSUCC0821]
MLHSLGYRCRVTSNPDVLDQVDVLLLPGVGAFASAMAELNRLNLITYIQDQARLGRPIIGICLGMQLLADSSEEYGLTAGLGLIPGCVVPLSQDRCHIGWNSIEVIDPTGPLVAGDGRAVYFNHSFEFQAPAEYRSAVARLHQDADPIVVGVQRGAMIGLQFHPEKSQLAGRQLLSSVISELCSA